jgi:hypothetical protein
MLRQNIMCHADVGLITANWVSFRETPWPNFNTVHMCRDFDAVFDIVEKHQLADFQPDPPEQPAGVTTLDTPP